ncbi:hypothetical protein SASPL_157002 [Salvia splendens]|uniref:Peptidase A1 domain-containing protein n=1 Tax=Salvia splendens TaxID=180675 RepID=A0A8X8VVP2_SALSN|nr:hypothetical protein SASPL_157002 [Salvia splendens]
MKMLRVQTEQWRKAADAAATVLAGDAEANGRRISERCGSMDKLSVNTFDHVGGYTGYVGSPGLMDDRDDIFGGEKRKGIRMFGDLWKKKSHNRTKIRSPPHHNHHAFNHNLLPHLRALVPPRADVLVGFTLELVHRDSPNSPLYQANLTTAQRFLKHTEISIARASHFNDHVHAEIRLPPCTRCFQQDGPIFEPKKSSSFKLINKTTPRRKLQVLHFGKGCSYSVGYYSGQSSSGLASTETFSFESSLKAPATVSNLVFGCGTSNSGSFPPAISGILGMDREPTSLPQQLGTGIKNRFSYCLSPTTSSYVRFGDEAVIQGRNVQRTPFLETKNKRSVTSYALPLMDLSINGRRLGEVPEGIYIDSGSSLSLLETSVYVAVKNSLASYFASFHDVKRNVRFVYDLQQKMLSFAPEECSRD